MLSAIHRLYHTAQKALWRVRAAPDMPRDLFVGLLIILTGISCFALGRLSAYSAPAGSEVRLEQTFPVGTVPMSANTSLSDAPVAGEGSASSGMYVASKNGSAYHLPWCSGAKRIKEENKVWFASKAEAEASGYAPAANCPGI